jgi:hypothetical protein
MRSRPSSTQPRSSNWRKSRLTISRTLPKLFGELLLRRGHHRPALDEKLREPRVEAAECHLLDELHDLRETLPVHAEHESAERLMLDEKLLKKRRRDTEQCDVGFGHARGAVVGLPEQAAPGEETSLSRLHVVEHDLAPSGRGLRHPHRPLEQQGKSAARLPGMKQHGSLRRAHRLGFTQESLEERRGEPPECRESSK